MGKRSQETRKSLSVVKETNASDSNASSDNSSIDSEEDESNSERGDQEYGRVNNVAGVLASIEKSSRQLRTYYSRALSTSSKSKAKAKTSKSSTKVQRKGSSVGFVAGPPSQ